MKSDLTVRYRPESLDEVIGQDHIVGSLRSLESVPHAILLVGPSGVGKTTVARIIAWQMVKIRQDSQLVEIDGASYSGIDTIRALQESIRYPSIGRDQTKFVIIDECHSLSKQAWQALLKTVEEPPDYVYFVFCTTVLQKVPQTIQTRCHDYVFRNLNREDLYDLLMEICNQELKEVSDTVLDEIIRVARGSARKALVSLSKVIDIGDVAKSLSVLEGFEQGFHEVDFCRYLTKQKNPTRHRWRAAMKYINAIDNFNPEAMRMLIFNYFTTVVSKDAKADEDVLFYLSVLDAFSEPYTSQNSMGEFLVSLGRVLFREELQ